MDLSKIPKEQTLVTHLVNQVIKMKRRPSQCISPLNQQNVSYISVSYTVSISLLARRLATARVNSNSETMHFSYKTT